MNELAPRQHDKHLLGGTEGLRAATSNHQSLTFISDQLWANRGQSQMTVWVNA